MKTISKPIKNLYQNLQKRYRIVAYNNRLYPDWKFVNPDTYTMVGVKQWLSKYGKRDRYLYDIYDVKTGELKYDYEKMIIEYLKIRSIFNDEKSINPILHQESIRKYIFCFKNKWETVFSYVATKPYFEELMILYNNYFDKYDLDSFGYVYTKTSTN